MTTFKIKNINSRVENKCNNKIIIGIDPGVSGAITIIDLQLTKITVHKMPETPTEIHNILERYRHAIGGVYVCCEKVSSSPQMGVSTAFKFGRVFGWLEGILDTLLGLCVFKQLEYVSPVNWQRALNCMTAGDKKISLAKAKELFPDAKGITQQTADSALIAYYGYVKYAKDK